jgi:hypothetical protein
MRTPAMMVTIGTGLLVATTAAAKPTGITGASGKGGDFCNKCHSGGATPTVMLTGPAVLAPGGMATYTLTITGGAAVAGGLDAALDDAALAAGATLGTVTANTRVAAGEVTHNQPLPFDQGTLKILFSVKASDDARAITLYVAGNSTNKDGTNSGDRGAATTMAINVVVPDLAGATDAASGASDLATAAPDLAGAPSPSGRDMATPAGDSGSAGPPAGMSSGGCAVVPGRHGAARGRTGEATTLVALMALLLGRIVRLSRRARRGSAGPATTAFVASWRARARH